MFTRPLTSLLTAGVLGFSLLGSGCSLTREADTGSVAMAPGDSPTTEDGAAPSRSSRTTLASTGRTRAVKLVSSGDLGIPKPGVIIDPERTAIVVTDPQNDFLSPKGVTWGVVGESVTENRTVENIGTLFSTAKSLDIPVFVSPHYYYPHDHGWKFEGALEALMHKIGMFDREDPLSLQGFDGSGADWLERYKPYIKHRNTTVTSPHKVYGPDTNDLVLQLRKRGIDKVILAGMSANLCTESHMRGLVEQGFEVVVVADATAAAKVPAGDGYHAALTNFRFIASAVVTTEEAVKGLREAFDDRSVASRHGKIE